MTLARLVGRWLHAHASVPAGELGISLRQGIPSSVAEVDAAGDVSTIEDSLTRIYVGNLPYQTSDGDLKSAFGRYGTVSDVRLMTDPGSGRARGFAFVSMPRLEDADEAISRLNGSTLHGRKLVVNEARRLSRDSMRVDPPQESRWHLI